MQTKEPSSIVPWLIIGVLGFMLLREQPQSPPQPDKPKVEKVVAKMMADVSAGYAKEFEKAAADVGNGTLKNEEALHKQLKDGLENVRSVASSDLNGLLDANTPTEIDDGNRGAVSTFLRSVASGFK